MTTPIILAITAAHIASFRECLDTVAREKRWLAQVEAPPLERVEGFVRDGIAAGVAQFVAVDGDRVVGWADIFPAWAAAVSHCGSLGMGVLAPYRRQGLGERLLRACIGKAQLQGLTRIELEARADNVAALALYRRVGFVQEAVKRRALRFDGIYFDSVLMSLLASEPGA